MSQPCGAATDPSVGEHAELTITVNQAGAPPRQASSVGEPVNTPSRGVGECPGSKRRTAEDLYQKVRSLVPALCAEPMQAKAIAKALGVTKPTPDAWIRRLVQERVLKKVAKPVCYVTCEKYLLEMT